jgi:FkbM family methyltransferase
MMPQRLNSIARGMLRRLASFPLEIAGKRMRADAVERLSQEMIAVAPIPGGAIRFFAPTPLLQDRAATLLTKEPDMISWLNTLLREAVLWDIGANVGVFGLYAAVRTGCTVLAFEPSAANFHVLARNIQLNDLGGRMTAYCLALSGRTELGVLNLASVALGSAMSQFGKPGEMSRYSSPGTTGAVHGMVGFTVDEFIERFHPPFPTHLKMDVDGLESAILQGAQATLRDPRLRSAMVELSLTDRAERDRAMALMKRSGLEFVSHGEPQGTEAQRAANHLFVRPA